MVEEPLLEEEEEDDDGTNGKGGFRTLPFIIGKYPGLCFFFSLF